MSTWNHWWRLLARDDHAPLNLPRLWMLRRPRCGPWYPSQREDALRAQSGIRRSSNPRGILVKTAILQAYNVRGLLCYVQAVGITSVIDHWASCVPTILLIGHFRVPPGLCFKMRVGAQPLIRKSFFHSHANKTHFHKKGCAPSLILKVRVFGTRNWPIKVKTSVPKGALSGPRSKATNPNWDNKMKNIC